MNEVIKIVLAPVEPFLRHPERAYGVAALFAILLATSLARCRTIKPRHLVMLLAVFAWGLFGWIEVLAEAGRWDIRIDLLVTWPTVLAVSIAAAWAGFRKVPVRAPNGQTAEKSPNEASPRTESSH